MKSKDRLGFFDEPILGILYWKRIRITDGVKRESGIVKDAKHAASLHPRSRLPAFHFTEENPDWVMLYDIARQGQLTPRVLKNMRRSDLYFLAGHTFPHPKLVQPKKDKKDSGELTSLVKTSVFDAMGWDPSELEAEGRWDQVTKLQANAARARTELERRNLVWASVFVVVGAVLGSQVLGNLIG